MKQHLMEQALAALDVRLPKPVTLLIGGGAALLLAHKIRLETLDIDGTLLTSSLTPAELDPLVKAVARELKISPHWLNDYFNTFTYTLPKDFRERLVPVFRGKRLTALALGREDLLIMKCFAGREKDIGHARVLIRRGANIEMVQAHLQTFIDKGLPGAVNAVRFLDDLLDELEA